MSGERADISEYTVDGKVVDLGKFFFAFGPSLVRRTAENPARVYPLKVQVDDSGFVALQGDVVLTTLFPLFLAGGRKERRAFAKYVFVHDEFHLQGSHQERFDDAPEAVEPSVLI